MIPKTARLTLFSLLFVILNSLHGEVPSVEIERSGDDMILSFSSDPASYYILRLTPDPATPDDPIGMILGTGLVESLVDAGILAAAPERAFYRLEEVPRSDPKDTDLDGIDDVSELEFAFLDPLDADDASRDFDEDGFPNDDEINDYDTDPAQGNAAVLPPRILGLSFLAAREILEIAGFQVGAVTCVPTVHSPAVAVISPDLSPHVGLPGGASIDLTVSLPLDADLFIDQLNLTLFDGSEANTQAYYAAVDPFDERTTLADWIAANAFGSPGGMEAHAAYFNEADLGFGRRMFMRKDAVRTAYYTVNYRTADEAALGPQTDLATVCMEFSPHPIHGGDPYVKFFTYNGTDPDPSRRAVPTAGPGVRLSSIDLDGRGAKFQPGMCMTCHGGLPRQLVNGIYPDDGRTGARFIPFDVDSFTYPTVPGFTRTDQEAQFKELNRGILGSIPEARRFSFAGQVDIPDGNAAGVDIPLTVAGLPGVISDVNFSFDGVGPCDDNPLNQGNGVSHPCIGDLVVRLTSPAGTTVKLIDAIGRSAQNFCHTHLDDEATLQFSAVLDQEEPFTGRWFPAESLSAFDGENPNGVWTLNVSDPAAGDAACGGVSGIVGSVNHFSVHITPSQRSGAVNELIEGWYGGPTLPGTFDENFVPPGWLTPTSVAEGGDVVYHEVVAKTCRACHVMLTDRRPDLDFDAYDEFAVRRGIIESIVYDEGIMPMAKRTFDKFWKSTDPSQAEILAAWIDAPNRFPYLGAPQGIPDLGGPPLVMSTLVSGFTGTVEDLDFSFGGVGPCSRAPGDTNNGLTHSYVSDLRVTLTSPPPNSISVRLLDRVGGDGVNFCSMRLDDEAQISLAGVTGSQAPFVGSWMPGNSLSAFDGIDPNGVWELTIEDLAAGDLGVVQDWALHFNSLGATKGPGAPLAVVTGPTTAANLETITLDATQSLFADTFKWELVGSTPGTTGTILNPFSGVTGFRGEGEGIFTLKLTARGAAGKDVVMHQVQIENQPPAIISISATSPVRFPAASRVEAFPGDDNLPLGGGLTFLWEKASGPGNAYFDDPLNNDTDVTFSKPGTYILCLTISDGVLEDSAQVTVVVEDAMVSVGDAGNPADPATGLGAVAYEYRIGTFEVTNAQYAAFLNSVATAADPYGLFDSNMDAHVNAGIGRLGIAPNFTYFAKNDRDHWPVNFVSFFDCVRYVNWLHNGAAPGGDTEDGAYTLLGGTPLPSNGETVTRNAGAKFWIPSDHEWYKAAYHQPAASGGDADNYWSYATGSNVLPGAGLPPGTPPTANYCPTLPCLGLTPVGSYLGSESYYGTFDQAGNVWEVIDTIVVFGGGSGSGRKAGGPGADNSAALIPSTTSIVPWSLESLFWTYGFRIAGAPEGTGGNTAPVVSAGNDITLTPATLSAMASLAGSASDDGLPAPPNLVTTWSEVSGPAGAPAVTFANANSPATTATFAQHGDYVLRLTADDGELTSFDEVTIRILVSFENDIVPMLTVPAGTCLTCHNDGFAGGGLSLAVNGSTPKSCQDIYTALMPGPGGVRVNTTDPAASRLLVYPAQGSGATMPAVIGFEVGSDNYKKLLLWIQQGAPSDCGP